jgi:polygalacturonase
VNAILIFANPKEEYNQGTILGPGRHDGREVSGTLTLAPGAVVTGRLYLHSGAKVLGRGIITGKDETGWIHNGRRAILPIETYGGSGQEIRGISIFDPNAWAMQINESSGVTIDNVKIISSRNNSDGISLQSTKDVTVKNTFVRSWDDSIVVKNYTGPSENITVENCVLWTDLAQAMEIGFETNKGQRSNPVPSISDVKFNNIRVLHAMHKPPISIHNGDNSNISGVTFSNITIENYQAPGNANDGWNYLIDFTNYRASELLGYNSDWTKVWERGNITATVDGVYVLGGRYPGARFVGQDNSRIDGTVKNVFHQGTKLSFNGGNRCFISFE